MVYLAQQQRPRLKVSYILLFSVMTLHYHRLYQISSLEGKVQKIKIRYTTYTNTYCKTNNQDQKSYLNHDKKNSEYTFIFSDIPVKAVYLMMQIFNQPTASVHSFGMLTADPNCSQHYLLHFSVFKAFKAIFKTRPLEH